MRVILITAPHSALGWAMAHTGLPPGHSLVLAGYRRSWPDTGAAEWNDPQRYSASRLRYHQRRRHSLSDSDETEARFGRRTCGQNNCRHAPPLRTTDQPSGVSARLMADGWQGPVELTLARCHAARVHPGRSSVSASMGRLDACAQGARLLRPPKSPLTQFFEYAPGLEADGIHLTVALPQLSRYAIEKHALGSDGNRAKNPRGPWCAACAARVGWRANRPSRKQRQTRITARAGITLRRACSWRIGPRCICARYATLCR